MKWKILNRSAGMTHAEGSSLRGISPDQWKGLENCGLSDSSCQSQSPDDSQSKSQTDRDTKSYCRRNVVIRRKKQKSCLGEELEGGDCWIGVSLASDSGLILTARVGKHTDTFIAELVNSTTDKTDCLNWNTYGWGGYQRVLGESINHQIGKKNTQRLERTNRVIRQQTGRWHRRQNKFAKIWQQTKVISCYAAKPDKIALPLFLIFLSHLITISPSFNNLCSNSDNSSTDLNSRCAIYSFAECQTNSIKL